MSRTVERYQRCSYTPQDNNFADREAQNWYQEVSKLKAKYESLQRSQRHLLGEDLGPLSVKELQNLEKQLEGALTQARQRKTQIMVEQMEELRRKERHLGDINKQLKNKKDKVHLEPFKDYGNLLDILIANTFADHPPQSNSMDSEPTLQIGYQNFGQPDRANAPTSVAGESNFIQGWVL